MINGNVRRQLVIFAVLAAAGCAERGSDPTAERLDEKRVAYRQACVARELAAAAADDLFTLEEVAASPQAGSVGTIQRTAALAAMEYARAYESHAGLREAAYAYLDSAANHAATPADSVRYLGRSNAFTIRAPQPGSVEENVLLSYQKNFVDLLSDDDHPCNWDLPF